MTFFKTDLTFSWNFEILLFPNWKYAQILDERISSHSRHGWTSDILIHNEPGNLSVSIFTGLIRVYELHMNKNK